MLKRMTIFSFVFLFLITGIALFLILFVSSSNYNITPQKQTKKIAKYPTKQMRSNVLKDIYVSEKSQRLHHHIESPRSILTAFPSGNSFDLVEQMHNMKCYLQEKLDYSDDMDEPMQQIRFIESQEGIYHYSNHHFDAKQV